MNVTLLDLTQALTAVDVARTCPFCDKQAWGADQHETGCPFALAHLAIQSTEYGIGSLEDDAALTDHRMPNVSPSSPYSLLPTSYSHTQGDQP